VLRVRGLIGGLILVLVACSGYQEELEQSYVNLRARESTLNRPVGGPPELRVYRNPRYAGLNFAAVVVGRPVVSAAPYSDREYGNFVENLAGALRDGTARALASSGRFLEVLPADAPHGVPGTARCEIEASPHVTPSANAVARDPVFGMVQPRVTVVFTVTDTEGGEVILKFTEGAVSQWEYGPWAMDELVAEAVGITNHFGEALEKF